MNPRWWAAASGLAFLAACSGEGGWFSLSGRPCGVAYDVCTKIEVVPVDDGIVDFEKPCDDNRCSYKVVEGAVDIGPSYHPADHAMRLGPGTLVEVALAMPAPVDGATFSMNVRCDGGGLLYFLGDGITELASGASLVPDTAAWARHDWLLREPTKVFDGLPSPRSGRSDVTLRFRNRGTANCSIDRLVYRTTAKICVEHQTRVDPCPTR